MAEYRKNYILETTDRAITYSIVVNTEETSIYVSDITEYSQNDDIREIGDQQPREIGDQPRKAYSFEDYIPREVLQAARWGDRKVTDAIKEYVSIMARGFKKYLEALDASLYVATPELNNLGFINESQIGDAEKQIQDLAEKKLKPIEEKISDITERIKEALSEDNPDKEAIAELTKELDSAKASYNQVFAAITTRKEILRRLIAAAKENDRVIASAEEKFKAPAQDSITK